ncbi:MAG: hypothetical protein E7183_00700 [Erysipelotrichaceae bacterium]|nr:hypothetical protein [Erysipelotrichaceae bacterium]
MKKKIIICIVITFVLMWTVFFTTDSIRCKNNLDPIFSIEVAMYEDGGSIYYVGLFYNYYRVRENVENKDVITDYVITPWFFGLDYAKEKAFK